MNLLFMLRRVCPLKSTTLLVTILVLSSYDFAMAQSPFIMIWKTDNPGVSADNQITIPTTGGGYNYDIFWMNLASSITGSLTGQTGDVTITFPSAGYYSVQISGDFPRIYFNNEGDRLKLITVEAWGSIEWASMENAFWGCTNLYVHTPDQPDLSAVTNMSRMFKDADTFNPDISNWNTSNVTNMEELFAGADTFNQNLGAWNVSNVTNMTGIFSYCGLSSNYYTQTLHGWYINGVQPNVTVGVHGLNYCGSSGRQPLQDAPNNWTFIGDTPYCSFVTTWKTDNPGTSEDNQIMIPTFGEGFNYDVHWQHQSKGWITGVLRGQTGDVTITFPEAGTYRVEIKGDYPVVRFNGENDKDKIMTVEQWGDNSWGSMSRAFQGCSNLTIPASDVPDLQHVADMSYMFHQASSFNQRIGNWDVSSVTDMSRMFMQAISFNQDISTWDVSNVENMQGMFAGTDAFNQPIGNWDVSNVTDMSSMFQLAASFNQDIGGWSVGNVDNIDLMFAYTSAFNQGIGNWDVSSVTAMHGMFDGSVFNQDISNWDVSSVTDMSAMFRESPFTGDISNWDVSSVTDMANMFANTTFNGDISNWDVSAVESMLAMFLQSSFTGDISRWNVGAVRDMAGMFYESAFNGEISEWNVRFVTDMYAMFYGAAFNGDLGRWDISSVTSMDEMFDGSAMSARNYESTLLGWGMLDIINGEVKIPIGLTLGATGLIYCNETARNNLSANYGWYIYGDIHRCGPVIIDISDTTIHETKTLIIPVNILPGEFTRLAFNLDSNSSEMGMTIDTETGEFRWTPRIDQAGEYIVIVIAQDGPFKDSATFNISVRNMPVVAINDGLHLSQGERTTITNTMLLTEDEDNEFAEIKYTLLERPVNGTLFLDNTALALYDTFTQADVNNNLINYLHDGFNNSTDKFSFTVSDGEGGTVASTDFQIIIDIVTAAETAEGNEIISYPVPASGKVTISINNNWKGEVSFLLIDVTGRVMNASQTVKQTRHLLHSLDLNSIPPGVAFVKIEIGDTLNVLKVVKQ